MAFVPSDLDSIIAHWRGEDIPSGTPDPLNWDDVVSSWRLSASGTARPTYSATAIGGLPGLVFDGSNDLLGTSTTKTTGGQLALACVCKQTVNAFNGLVCLSTSSPSTWETNRVSINPGLATTNYSYYNNGTTGNQYLLSTNANANNGLSQLLTICHGASRIAATQNGFMAKLSDTDTAPKTDVVSSAVYAFVGKSVDAFFTGNVSEVVAWVEPYDTTHRLWIEGYLCHKYGITLPAWHPFCATAPTSGPSSGGFSVRNPFVSQVIR